MSKFALGELFVCLAPSLRGMKEALDVMLPKVAQLEELAGDPSVDVTPLVDAANDAFEDLKDTYVRMAKDMAGFIRSKGMDWEDIIDGAKADMMAAGTPKPPSLHVVEGGKEQ